MIRILQCPDYNIIIITKSYSESLNELIKDSGIKRIGFEEDLAFNRYESLKNKLEIEMV